MERTSAPKALGGEILPPGAEPLQADDPAMLDGHRLAGRLASGGTSTVYLARSANGDLVAVKTTRARKADETQARRWLRTEAACARRLPPFCTARLLVDGTDHSPPYLISEYVEGPSLAQFVEGLGPLDPEQLRALAVALARALSAVHGAGLIHCDLRPANILLASNGPRLIDFSIAQEVPISGKPAELGTVPFSPGWVAPERLSGYPAGPASDIFGWGCLIGYAATGRSPLDEDGSGRPSIAELNSLEEPIRGLVEAALAADPADRPSTAEIVSRFGHTGAHTASPTAGDERDTSAARPRPERHDTDVPSRPSASSVDAPTAPMPPITPELGPGPAAPHAEPPRTEPTREVGAPRSPALSEPVPGAPARRVEYAAEAGAVVPRPPSEPTPRAEPPTRRVPYAADPAAVAARHPSEPAAAGDPAQRRVEYSPEAAMAAPRPRTERPERRPRRLRAVAMVTAPAALVVVLATVIAVAGTGTGGQEPSDPSGAVTPGPGSVDSQAPAAPGGRSYGPRPASASSARDDSTTPTAGRRRHGRRSGPVTSSRPGGPHSPGSPPASSPSPTPTHTATPSPTPTSTGTVPAH